MPTLHELLIERAQLETQLQDVDARIKSERQAQKASVIAELVARMHEAGISPQELTIRKATKSAGTHRGKVPAKFRNAATGDSWSGRGKKPNWLTAALATGRKIEEFAV
jgi:DNA-binding protein H-NS